jgi:hypothetical protein
VRRCGRSRAARRRADDQSAAAFAGEAAGDDELDDEPFVPLLALELELALEPLPDEAESALLDEPPSVELVALDELEDLDEPPRLSVL